MKHLAIGLLLLVSVPALAADNDTLKVAPAPAGATALLQEAKALIEQGRAEEAYQKLAAVELEFAGNPQFDYLLGVAALDGRRPGEAVFSLARLLANEPDFDGARVELARAHFESGELEEARAQFAYLLTRNPPDATRTVIQRYLSAIDNRVGGRDQRWSGYAEVGGGFDSNANGSTDDSMFGIFQLDPENIETDSPYFDVAAGVNHSAGYSSGLFSDAYLRTSYRNNPDADFVDQLIASAGGGLTWRSGPWSFNGGVDGYYGWLDGEQHQIYAGLDAGVALRVGESWEFRLQGQGGPLRYQQDELEVQDVNRYLGSLGLTLFNVGAPGGRMTLSLLAGLDDEEGKLPGGGRAPYGNSKTGARLSGALPLDQQWALYFDAGWINSDYDDTPGFFGGIDRDDDQYTALVGMEFGNWPAPLWSLSPRLRYVRNESNISLYEYDRWEAGVTVRRSFR